MHIPWHMTLRTGIRAGTPEENTLLLQIGGLESLVMITRSASEVKPQPINHCEKVEVLTNPTDNLINAYKAHTDNWVWPNRWIDVWCVENEDGKYPPKPHG